MLPWTASVVAKPSVGLELRVDVSELPSDISGRRPVVLEQPANVCERPWDELEDAVNELEQQTDVVRMPL